MQPVGKFTAHIKVSAVTLGFPCHSHLASQLCFFFASEIHSVLAEQGNVSTYLAPLAQKKSKAKPVIVTYFLD